MFDPYRMIIVNIAASILLLMGILIYKYIFPKKKINYFYLLLLISIIPIISIFRTGAYQSGDFSIHVRRSMEFYKVLTEGNLIPSWAGDLNATYGYPLFAFNYILPYYITAFFHLFGFSFINSFKLLLSSSFIFSGIFMYLFSKNLFKKDLPAFGASIFYLFVPYHLIALHFGVTVGEVLSYTFIPLVFYFINVYFNSKKVVYLILSSLSLSLVLFSHILVAIFLVPVFFAYLILRSKNIIRSIAYSFFVVVICLVISSFQWSSSFIYKPYLFTTVYPPGFIYFPTLTDLLYAPWRFGFLFQGHKGELSFLIGYTQLAVIAIATFYILIKKRAASYKNELVFWLTIIFLTAFLIMPQSKFIWNHMQILAEAGTHRLLIPISFFTSILAGFVMLVLKKRKLFIYTLILLTIFTTILNWGQRTMVPNVNDAALRKDLPLGVNWGDGHFYANSRWVNPKKPWFSVIPKSPILITNGQGKIIPIIRTSTLHTYNVNAETLLKVTENTLYFPGWKASFNKKPISIGPDKNGVMSFTLPKGNGVLILKYEDLPLFTISKIVSAISLILVLVYVLYFTAKRFLSRPKS